MQANLKNKWSTKSCSKQQFILSSNLFNALPWVKHLTEGATALTTLQPYNNSRALSGPYDYHMETKLARISSAIVFLLPIQQNSHVLLMIFMLGTQGMVARRADLVLLCP